MAGRRSKHDKLTSRFWWGSVAFIIVVTVLVSVRFYAQEHDLKGELVLPGISDGVQMQAELIEMNDLLVSYADFSITFNNQYSAVKNSLDTVSLDRLPISINEFYNIENTYRVLQETYTQVEAGKISINSHYKSIYAGLSNEIFDELKRRVKRMRKDFENLEKNFTDVKERLESLRSIRKCSVQDRIDLIRDMFMDTVQGEIAIFTDGQKYVCHNTFILSANIEKEDIIDEDLRSILNLIHDQNIPELNSLILCQVEEGTKYILSPDNMVIDYTTKKIFSDGVLLGCPNQ